LKQSEIIDVPGPTLMHDFAITERHVIFMDLPVVFDLQLARAGKLPFRWSDDYGARLGVMPHGGGSKDVRWFEIAPCYVAHTFNAYEDEDGGIVVDVVRFENVFRGSPALDEPLADPSSLHRWRIDLASGRVSEQPLDDRVIEFPRCDGRRTGLPYRYGYALHAPGGGNPALGNAIIKYDFRSGAAEVHDFGAGCIPSEPVFVPASAKAAEDEGWLMTYVYDTARNGSDFVIPGRARYSCNPCCGCCPAAARAIRPPRQLVSRRLTQRALQVLIHPAHGCGALLVVSDHVLVLRQQNRSDGLILRCAAPNLFLDGVAEIHQYLSRAHERFARSTRIGSDVRGSLARDENIGIELQRGVDGPNPVDIAVIHERKAAVEKHFAQIGNAVLRHENNRHQPRVCARPR
jgi:hypothetical protein